MPTPDELTARFWKALRSDMTVMLGLAGKDEAHVRPMTAQLDEGREGPIWFFSSTDTALVKAVGGAGGKAGGKTGGDGGRAVLTFVDKGHDVFACVHGVLRRDDDRAVIDRLWSRFVAAWYEGGKDDPKLALLRFEPQEAEIWENATSLFAGIRILLGSDPKTDYKDKVAKVSLG